MHGLPAASCLCGTYRGAGTLPKALAICQRLGKFPGRGRTKAINPLYDSNGVWKIQRNFDSIGPMPETEIENLSNRVNPVTIAAAPTNGTLETTEANGVSQPADKLRSDASTKGMPGSESPRYLAEALKDAERLLKYSAETGTTVEDDIRHYILQARAADNGSGWDKEIAANLLMALTKLAARVKPVTAESVKWCENTRPAVRTYFLVAICLAFFIVPFSVVSFVATAISTAIRNDIVNGNDLAVKLRVQFPPPSSATQAGASTSSLTSASGSDTSAQSSSEKSGDERDKAALSEEITELQLFASNIRAIDARARQLNVLLLNTVRDPNASVRGNPAAIHKKFELPEGLPDLAQAANDRINVYQDVRYFAQNLLDDVSFYYGAVTTCILPVLYALLGTCAYLLRSFEEQIRTRTFIPSEVNVARFLIAGIGGAVVGLFNNFNITQGASIPPLAIAFLVGYAVDVFFAFLEGLLQTFTKNTRSPELAPSGGTKT
jgi:hypothetical protein